MEAILIWCQCRLGARILLPMSDTQANVCPQDPRVWECVRQGLHGVLGQRSCLLCSHPQLLPQRLRLQRPGRGHQGGEAEELSACLRDGGKVCRCHTGKSLKLEMSEIDPTENIITTSREDQWILWPFIDLYIWKNGWHPFGGLVSNQRNQKLIRNMSKFKIGGKRGHW